MFAVNKKERIKIKETCTPNIIKPTQTFINRHKYTFCVKKALEHLKNSKTGRVPY
jgi:hypothetical protein